MSLKLTPQGIVLLSYALAGTAKLEFTYVQVGSGGDAGPTPTALDHTVLTVPFQSILPADSKATLTAVFNNSELQAGFRMTEIGIFALDPEDPGVPCLYAYEYIPPADADYIPANSDRILETKLSLMVFIGEAANVTVRLRDEYAAFPHDKASGSPASFPDGAEDVPVKSLTVNITAVQEGSGDPSPDNIRPISGFTGATVVRVGKNLFPPYTSAITISGVTLTPNGDGSFSMQGTASSSPFTANRTLPFPIAPGMAYSFRLGNDRVNSEVGVRLTRSTDGSSTSYGTLHRAEAVDQTVDGAELTSIIANRVQAVVASNHGAVETITLKPQLELGAMATEWAPHSAETVTVSWEDEAGTVYDGMLELPSGVLTVTKKLVTVDENYLVSRITSVTQYNTDTGFWLAMGNDSNTVADKMQNRCNQASPSAAAGVSIGTTNTFGAATSYPHSIWVRLSAALVGTTAASIHEYISAHPLQFLVSLETPVQYQLTPTELRTLLGTNNIWADCGDVEVEYRADTGLYIDKKFAALQALILENG